MQVYLNTLQQAEAELLRLQPADEAEEEQIPQAAATRDPVGTDSGADWEKGALQVMQQAGGCSGDEASDTFFLQA